MADRVPDEFLKHWAKRFREDPGADSNEHASVYEELLRRRQDGMSPEEFVLGMAARAAEVSPAERSHFLHSLGEIQRHVWLVRCHLRQLDSQSEPDGAGRELDKQNQPSK